MATFKFCGTEYHANHQGYLGFGLNYAVIRNIGGSLKKVLCLSIHDVFQNKDACKEFCREMGGTWAPHPQKFWYVPLKNQHPKDEEAWRKAIVECLEIADAYLKEVGSMSMRKSEERFISVFEGQVVEILKEEIELFGQPRPQVNDAVLGGKSAKLKYDGPATIPARKMKELGGQENHEGDWIFSSKEICDRAMLERLRAEDTFWKKEYDDPNNEAGDLDAVERQWAHCTAQIRELENSLAGHPNPAPPAPAMPQTSDDRTNYQKLVDRFVAAGNSEENAKKGAMRVLDAASEYLEFEEIAYLFSATHHDFIEEIMRAEKASLKAEENRADEIADRRSGEILEILEQLDCYSDSPISGTSKQQNWAKSIRGFAIQNWLASAVANKDMSFEEAVKIIKNPDCKYWIDNRKKWGCR